MSRQIKHILENWITSTFGFIILGADIFYLIRSIVSDTISLEKVVLIGCIGAIGYVFLKAKDSLITGLFNKKINT